MTPHGHCWSRADLEGREVHVWKLGLPGGDRSVAGELVEAVLLEYVQRPRTGPLIDRRNPKPRLADAGEPRFSVSYAGDLLVMAVADRREVGVDAEPVSRRLSDDLQRHVLTAAERSGLEGVDEEGRGVSALRLWVAKEALLKAAGVGLAVDPALVELGPPGGQLSITALPGSIGPAERWELHDHSDEQTVIALAVERPGPPAATLSRL